MADVFFDNPPIQSGSPEEQLRTLYSYLSTISMKLNEAMMTISLEQASTEAQKAVSQAVAAEEKTEKNRQDLKSLIIKTAEIVRTEMEEIG